ncbi:hypothetical protein GCM10011445_00650 [Pseudocitrobacter faecalis]|nr:hypothetical protein GCM10011445_00650 [Pseudocitrobacter faecalis]
MAERIHFDAADMIFHMPKKQLFYRWGNHGERRNQNMIAKKTFLRFYAFDRLDRAHKKARCTFYAVVIVYHQFAICA